MIASRHGRGLRVSGEPKGLRAQPAGWFRAPPFEPSSHPVGTRRWRRGARWPARGSASQRSVSRQRGNVPVGADNSFHVHLLRLEAFARRIPGAPQWTSVLVSEAPLTAGHATVRVERRFLKAPLEYALEFQVLLARGYPWINLHAAGLLGDELLVEVDHAALGHLGCRSSVNLAGPENATLHEVAWQLGDRLTVVD